MTAPICLADACPREAALMARIAELERAASDCRDERQRQTFAWARAVFGDLNSMAAPRGVRLLEEAVEVAQALGIPSVLCQQVIAHVYSKPAGRVSQELGGVGGWLVSSRADLCPEHREYA